MGVPYTFGTATTSIPLSQLDANFNTPVTLGNTTVGLGNTVTSVGNLTLTNVTITSGTINASVVDSGYTANAVIYANSTGVLTDGSANLTFNGTTLTAAAITSTGIATFSAGTVSAPAITTTGDTNTGIFFPAADTIAFTEGGVESMRIDSSGRLLLGTTAVTTSSSQSGEIYSTGATGFMMTNSTAANYALAVKNEGTSGTKNLINFYEGAAGGTSRANISLDGSNNFAFASTNATTFSTASAERMRITSGGDLLIGTTSALSNAAKVQINGGSGSTITSETTGTGATDHVNFRNGNGKVGTITTNGSATSYNTSSDYRLKENIAPMTGALVKVAQLKPVTYKWKADGSNGQGFIAHELQAVVPDAVTGEKDAVDKDGKPTYQGVDTSYLVATLTAAIQELKAELDSVKAELQTLKGN